MKKSLKILRYKLRKTTVDPPSDAETIASTESIQPAGPELTLLWTDEKAGKKRKNVKNDIYGRKAQKNR